MAYNETLAERVRSILGGRPDYSERNMFGGVCFMLGGNMCCGVTGDRLMLRFGDLGAQKALKEPHVQPMDFTGRAMRGMVFVTAGGYASDRDLKRWLSRAVKFAAALPPKRRKKIRQR